jgi:hypothetical protein
MWARVAMFENVNFDRMEQRGQEGAPAMPNGMQGGMVLASRDSGKSMFIAYFDSKESIDAASEFFERMGDDIPEEERGKRTAVEAYEVVWDSTKQ